MIVSGSTGSGKSEWIMRLLRNVDKMFSTPIERVIYSYGELNTNVINLQRAGKVGNVPVTVHSGVPRAEQVRECAKKEKTLLVLDYLVVGINQQYLDALFTRGSHNWGISVILVTQHLFNKELRVAHTNSHYLVLMLNPAGALQIRTIATHLFPSRNAHFIEAYRDACAKNFGFLLANVPGGSDEQLLCLVEICLNILKGRVPLRPRHLNKLKAHAQVLRRLARKRCSRSAKKVLLQHGDGLPAIVGLIASIASIALPLIGCLEIINKRFIRVWQHSPSDGTPIGLIRNRIKQIKNDDCINDAERAAKYEQELKRLNKLTKDEDERPVGVRLENLNDVVDAMPKPVNVRRPIVVATRRHLKVGRNEPSSSVYDIVSHLLNKDKRAQNKEPTAFKEFVERARQIPLLIRLGELNTNVINLQRAGKVGNVPVTVHSGVPRAEQVRECAKKEKTLLVLDYLVVGINQQYLDALFTRGSHNWGISVILVTQHLFNKELRVAHTNSHYLVLMLNPAGALQIRTIATHLFPSRNAHFIEAYRDACAKNFGFLLANVLIRGASDEQLLCLVEICLNILKGRVPLRPRHLNKLKAHAQVLRRLARKRCSRSAKKVLLQHGDGLPAIVGLIASIALPLIADRFIRVWQHSPSDGTPIGLIRNRIKQIKNDDCINDAERAAKYEQELKRLNKLTKDEDERPVGVRLENLNDVVDAMPKPVNVRRPIVVATRRHLKFLYKDLSSPVAFTSVEPLLREARKTQPKINRTDVQNYLATQRTYTLHRQAKRRYRRLPTLAPGLHTEWQADLAIFDRLAKQNRGYKYLLVCIDTLSRQVFVEPVKTKTSANMIIAFEHIFKRSKYIPWKVLTDQGKEFTARAVQHFFRAKDVEHFCMLTSPQFHAGMAERANRSIKERLYRYFTERNTYKWIAVVQDIVRAINHSPNSTIGMCPADVNFQNAEALRQKLHNAAENVVRRQPRYRVGDRVRIEKYKHVFKKGYLPRFTNELFTVAEVHPERSPVVYRLRDDHNEIISGWFYANDLCKTLEDKQQKMYIIEKILKKKRQNGVDYALVKWEGNRTNSFRVRLPRKLEFNSEWEVGLAVIVYPHSWPSIGTVEQQFVQIEWQTGNTVRIEVPPSNVTNPHELSKNLYRLLGEGSDPLAKKVRSTQNSFMLTINKARRWAREEYIKRKTKEKRSVRDEELLLQAMLTDTGTLVDLNSVTHGLLAREKSAATSNVLLRIPADDDDSYQKKLDEYFSKLSDKNLSILDELGMTKLNAEIKNLTEEERAILEATKEMGTEAWIQAYREIRLVCQFNYDVHRNRFVLNTDPRYVKKVEVSPQLAYILGFNNTESMQAENEARFMPDMSGGVSSFHVYTPDLIEPMMIGDVTAPVLRIVTIRGAPDQVIEEQFFAIQYHKILLKEVSEILIEIRTNSGSLMPFQYGTSDQIPAVAIAKFPHCMVVNLDPSTSHGSHWVCIYCASPLHLEYYDSLGMWPRPSVHIVNHFLQTQVRVVDMSFSFCTVDVLE
ncbi:hypothetical protein niasHT_032054 [Heterodera trifolii]|uniref:Integrase catalytic domain-containing protein n=1 Tax=Heterodera trifolii TaxID=157864 RepID=A0ABD2IED7_9BILA